MGRVLEQAMRIHSHLQGIGVGRKFMELGKQFLAKINPEVI